MKIVTSSIEGSRSGLQHRLLSDEWLPFGGAIGSTTECVASLQRFRDAGADEIAVQGSAPIQNSNLVAAWGRHTKTGRG